MKRTIALLLGAVSLGAASLTLAAPAQARVVDCQNFLRTHGYSVGPKVTKACNEARDGTGMGWWACKVLLQGYGVKEDDASLACDNAAG
ncbi:hypothetical protein [Streptomyces sp. YGL11-2]|uniref:hypothetical protein n=1 Tax=Streptomyces sp. YGL11-2 TaxID=3414028 RepID=UPI003CEC6BA6